MCWNLKLENGKNRGVKLAKVMFNVLNKKNFFISIEI